ncbi:MAG: Fpg/Nei family DNA glycosylase [Symploca sp. SIO2D2]|nr:Fpg/Nei family DNA glycosylase [Symploca sp. SIO2D2]
MPELAEVAFYASKWSLGIAERIRKVDASKKPRCLRDLDHQELKNALVGGSLQTIETHGKQMLMGFCRGSWMGIHLGMTGSLRVAEFGESRLKHDHFVIETEKRLLVFSDPRQFGRVRLSIGEGRPDWWKSLGIEVLSEEFDYGLFRSFCERRKNAVLKTFLLNQELFPGVGNWMADEILWKARLRPNRRVISLDTSEQKALFKALKFVCRGAMEYIAPDWSDPPKSWLFKHRWKDGGICPQTGKLLRREQIGGRTTCWSEAWQK